MERMTAKRMVVADKALCSNEASKQHAPQLHQRLGLRAFEFPQLQGCHNQRQ